MGTPSEAVWKFIFIGYWQNSAARLSRSVQY
jgi:hypothetical protein